MPYVVYNVGTESTVSHTESMNVLGSKPVDIVWEHKNAAARHAYDLTVEYGFTRPELTPPYRTWRYREATPEQVLQAKAVGAFGEEYGDIIGTGPVRAGVPLSAIRDPAKGDGDEVEKFREMLDRRDAGNE